MQVKIVLAGMRHTLDGVRPNTRDGVTVLQKSFREGFSALVKLTQAAAYSTETRDIVEIIRSQITEKVDMYSQAPAPGLVEWCEQMECELQVFETMDSEGRELYLDGIKYEMEDHKCQIDFSIESIDGAILP